MILWDLMIMKQSSHSPSRASSLIQSMPLNLPVEESAGDYQYMLY